MSQATGRTEAAPLRKLRWWWYSEQAGANGTGPFGPIEARSYPGAKRIAEARARNAGLTLRGLERVDDEPGARTVKLRGRDLTNVPVCNKPGCIFYGLMAGLWTCANHPWRAEAWERAMVPGESPGRGLRGLHETARSLDLRRSADAEGQA